MPFKIVTHQLEDKDFKIKRSGVEYIKVIGKRTDLWSRFKDLFRKKHGPLYIYTRED
jgi:hypothetical protein